jgi:hypothetical protein
MHGVLYSTSLNKSFLRVPIFFKECVGYVCCICILKLSFSRFGIDYAWVWW